MTTMGTLARCVTLALLLWLSYDFADSSTPGSFVFDGERPMDALERKIVPAVDSLPVLDAPTPWPDGPSTLRLQVPADPPHVTPPPVPRGPPAVHRRPLDRPARASRRPLTGFAPPAEP